MKETEGEDIWKHYTAQPVILFLHAQLIDFAASAQGEKARPDRTVRLALLGEGLSVLLGFHGRGRKWAGWGQRSLWTTNHFPVLPHSRGRFYFVSFAHSP